jgi:hypothetical protein
VGETVGIALGSIAGFVILGGIVYYCAFSASSGSSVRTPLMGGSGGYSSGNTGGQHWESEAL